MRTVSERFWSKVDQSVGPDGCWLWKAQVINGYGIFKMNGNARTAHLVAYELTAGEVADGMKIVRVGCKNRRCVNPAHLSAFSAETALRHRFFTKVDISDGENACWLWTAGKTSAGYGVFRAVPGEAQYAHRVSYWLATGDELDGGKDIDHVCRNPPCVNPSHLRLVTRSENQQNRGVDPRNTSGYRGVSRNGNRWSAEVKVNGRKHHLGLFATPEEAAAMASAFRAENMPFSEMDKS